jgi:hypothetical protein
MATLASVTALLQRLSLDRTTKLQVLDILAANADPKVLEDVEGLLLSYEEMNLREDEALKARLSKIDAKHQEAVQNAATAMQRDAKRTDDEAKRLDEIEQIRQSLM